MKKLLLFSLLSTTTTIYAQQNCLSLQGSTACPALQQYYISTQNFNFLSNVTTVSQLDNALFKYVTSADLYLNPLGCLNNAVNNTNNIPYARYSLSYLCESLIQDSDYSLPCNYNNNLSPPPLCQSTCFQFMQSIDQFTDTISTCPNQNYRDQQIQTMNQTCLTWSGLNGTGNCILGIANEPDNCGFSSKSEACQYCKSNSNDTCCGNVSHCVLLSGGAIAGIVIGVLVFISLIIIALLYYRKKRRLKQKETVGYESMGSQRALQTSSEPKLHQPRDDDEEYITNNDGMAALEDEEEFYQVRHPYPAQMSDELGLVVGDIVCVAMHFDDGWALGFNVTTGLKGVFPVVCVAPIPHGSLEQLLNQAPPPPAVPIHDEDEGYTTTKILVEDEDVDYSQGTTGLGNIPRRTASKKYQEQQKEDIVESIELKKNTKRVSKLEEN